MAIGTDDTVGATPGTDATQPAPAQVDALADTQGGTGQAPRADPMSSPDSTTSSAYRVGREIARGGMGRILTARDLRLERPVALKQLHPGAPSDLQRRFRREALLTARLQHPGIVPVYEAGRLPDGTPFYAMRMVAGRSLDLVIAEKHSVDERIGLLPAVIAIAEALAYAHSQRVIHRDLKPANVLAGAFGETVVIDWGLAKDLGDVTPEPAAEHPYRNDPALTSAGAVMGTPAYMPPEQAAGEVLDERADVYAIGAILYHLLAGRAPYRGKSVDDVLAAVEAGPPAPLEPDVPRDLATIVSKAMARDKAARYPTAHELAADLVKFQTGQLVGAHRYSTWQLVRRWLRKHRGAVSVSAIALATLAVLGVLAIWRIVREQRESARQRDVAEQRASDLVVEQARQELLAGDSARALAYLEPVIASARSTTVRFLTARALAPSQARIGTVGDAAAENRAAWFSPDGQTVFIRTRTTLESHDAQGKHTGTVTLPEGFLDFVTVHDQLHLARARAGAVELLDPGGTVVRTLALGEHAGIAIDATPDGSRWAVARDDGHVMVWGADATPLYTIAAHPARALSLALSPDGKLLATAVGPAAQGVPRGQDAAAAKLWNAETGAPIAELPGQQFEAADLSFSADSRHLLTLADAVRVWDGRGGLVLSIATLPGHTQAVSLSPDGLRLAVARGDARPELWDLERGVTTAALAGHTTQVRSVAWSPDGQHVATLSNDGSLRLFDADSGALVMRLQAHGTRRVTWSPDGRRLLTTAFLEEPVELWAPPLPLSLAGADPRGISVSPDRRALAMAGPLFTASVWDLATRQRVTTLAEPHDNLATTTTFSPDGKLVATTSEDHSIKVWDARTGRVVHHLKHDDLPDMRGQEDYSTAVAFTPDGGQLADLSGAHLVRVWDLRTGQLVRMIEVGYQTMLSPHARYALALGAAGTDPARLWNLSMGAGTAVFSDAFTSAAFSADERQIVAGDKDGFLTRIDAGSGRVMARTRAHSSAITLIALARDGRVASATETSASVVDVAGITLATMTDHPAEIDDLAFTPDGTRMVTSSAGAARVFDAGSGRLLAVLAGHRERADLIDVVDDRLITRGGDGVELWDISLESRPATDVAALIRSYSPWRIERGQLVPRAR